MEALRTRQDRIRFVEVRHQESAAFMACAYVKFTGKLGVCLATSGPRGIHLLNGLAYTSNTLYTAEGFCLCNNVIATL
jgi:thiamine pyrophosphate-dependent acetolactate synthase large subunit-like protein